MNWTTENIMKEMARIHASIPSLLKKSVVKSAPLTPTIELVMKEALTSPKISQEKKGHIQRLLDSGTFNKRVYKENPRVAKQIDSYIGREINKSIKAGRLPTKKQLRSMPEFSKYTQNE